MNFKNIFVKSLIIICIFIVTFLFYIWLKNVNPIIECGGGFETAYVTWYDKEEISSYHVYIKNVEEDNYTQIDDELIRKYNEDNHKYWRADALGLSKGLYQFKIVPIIDNKEDEKNSVETIKISVKANVREGFSFSKISTNGGKSSGGYSDDGTVPEDAEILYINKENANSVTLNIKNDNGDEIKAVGLSEILSNWKKENVSKHLIIRILGLIEKEDIQGLDIEDQAIKVPSCQNLTIEGIGNDATLKGVGLLINESCNIEIRNLGFMLFHEDAVSLDKNNTNIWVHNNDFFYGEDRDGDKIKGDGSTDIKESKYITVSYNHYWDSGKTSLCGVNNDIDFITYHHNWFDYCDSRSPRVRYASVHVYNNYYVGNSHYCVGATCNSSVFVEANYFKDCRYPMKISGQNKNVISNEEGGMIKAYNNHIEGIKTKIVFANSNKIEFDAYLAKDRAEKVPEDYKTLIGENTYNNFDTNDEIMYEYKVNNPSEVKNIVKNDAGRIQGGDIKFNTTKLDVNSCSRWDCMEKELDNMLKNYER